MCPLAERAQSHTCTLTKQHRRAERWCGFLRELHQVVAEMYTRFLNCTWECFECVVQHRVARRIVFEVANLCGSSPLRRYSMREMCICYVVSYSTTCHSDAESHALQTHGFQRTERYRCMNARNATHCIAPMRIWHAWFMRCALAAPSGLDPTTTTQRLMMMIMITFASFRCQRWAAVAAAGDITAGQWAPSEVCLIMRIYGFTD